MGETVTKVVLPSGYSLECPAYPEPCSYVAVLDPSGGETARVPANRFLRSNKRTAWGLVFAGVPKQKADGKDYGAEMSVKLADGCAIRMDATPGETSYIRFVHPNGREIEGDYWIEDEWSDSTAEAEDVVGAIMGAARSHSWPKE
jgi:hypothetical protein